MKINHTTYNEAGELMAPRPQDLSSKRPPLGGQPSTDAGFYHRFRFDAASPGELLDKQRRFFDIMGDVPGFTSLQLLNHDVHLGNYRRLGMDIVYVVEAV